MKLLITGAPQLEALLPDVSMDPKLQYRPSVFNYIYRHGEAIYVYNTLSRRLALIDPQEESTLTGGSQQIPEALVQKRFLVRQDTDETKHYAEAYAVLDSFARLTDRGYSTYEILPTTSCNARCFYCYEAGTAQRQMTPETADAVVEFIRRTRDPGKKLRLYWFGGEPLCRPEIIDRICRQLTKNRIPFYSTMVTNGILWTPELIRKAKKHWLLDRVQVSLDGYGEEHNRRKAYHGIAGDPFTKTIDNISALVNAGIGVMVRLNMDPGNIESIHQVYEYMKARFTTEQRILFDPATLMEQWFQWSAGRTPEQQAQLRQAWQALRTRIAEDGFSRAKPLSNSLPRHFCMANDPSCVTLLPDGNLSLCQTGNENLYYGDVWQGIAKPELLDQWRCNTTIRPKCSGCTWLPECTGFAMCTAQTTDCKENAEDRFRHKLRRTISDLKP